MKRIAILAIAAMFVIAGTAFAAEQMTNDELAGVKAGDWAVKNKLELDETAQQNVQAISNANLVDSGAAVQSNVISVTENPAGVTNTNDATVAMSRAASVLSITNTKDSTKTETEIKDETEDSSDPTSRGLLGLFAENTAGTESSTESKEETKNEVKNEAFGLDSRCAKSTKNTLYLTNESQMEIAAISNLNAVASGVAVQSNIVSSVGMTGSLTNSNIANVQSGL